MHKLATVNKYEYKPLSLSLSACNLKEFRVSQTTCESLSIFLTQAPQLIQRSMQQSLSAEMQSLLSTESFKVTCCSVLKEMAVSCDLTDLEKV